MGENDGGMENVAALLRAPESAMTIPVATLEKVLRLAADQYYNSGTSLMSDDLFDRLLEVLRGRKPNSKVLTDVGAPVVVNKVDLPYPMLSLDKVKPGTEQLTKWIERQSASRPFVTTDKLDGTSAMLVYSGEGVKMYRRGTGLTGADVSHLIEYIIPPHLRRGFPGLGPDKAVAVRGEIIIPREIFIQHFADKFTDARSLVNSLVNRKNLDRQTQAILRLTDFVAYEVVHPRISKMQQIEFMDAAGFKVVHAVAVQRVSEEFLINQYARRRAHSPYFVDGLVVESNGPHTHGGADRNPTYAVAFKMTLDDQGADTEVVAVVWEASKDRKLIPRVQYQPIVVNGVTLQWATGMP